MALNKITFEDKVSLNPQPSVANKNKVSDADMNEIKAVVNQVVEDTGWVDLSSYLNTTYFSIRTGLPPMVRKIGNVVYWKGSVYCSTAVNNREVVIMSGIPSQFLPPQEYSNSIITWYTGEKFAVFISSDGSMAASKDTNIGVQNDWAGITLSNLSGYVVD